MMAIPVIAITAAVMALRNSTSGIQNSIYMVYLEGIGIGAFEIGILFAAIEGASGLGSLLGGRAMRLGDPQWTLVIGTAIAIFAIQGVMQPVMFSVQSRTVGPYEQGAVVGLRQTVNRASAILVPPVMGLIAKYWGIAESFLILGAGLLFFCLVVAIWIHRSPPFEG
jgi:fucose permease